MVKLSRRLERIESVMPIPTNSSSVRRVFGAMANLPRQVCVGFGFMVKLSKHLELSEWGYASVGVRWFCFCAMR